MRYFHHDQLGSVAAVSNELGAVIERLAYDPWGKRRNINGLSDVTDSLVGRTTDRGFTEHEHLDEMGVVHMNGRIYDPLVGRFMSADPFIQAPSMLQSYNRYAYVMNNPLNLTDPSGYLSLRSVVKIVVIAVISYYTAGAASGAFASASGGASTAFGSWAVTGSAATFQLSAVGGALAGAAGGFVGGALSTGTLKGGVQGAFTGGVFGGIGANGAGNGWGTGEYVAAHAAGGCITSVASGGACGSGAASAAFGKFTTLQTQDWGFGIAQGTAAAVAGGVGSVIAGGKFENGATTAAFGYLFNCGLSPGCWGRLTQGAQSVWNRLQVAVGNAMSTYGGQMATEIAAAEVGLSTAALASASRGVSVLQTALANAVPDPKHTGQFVSVLEDGSRMMFRKEFGHVPGYGPTDHINVHLQAGSKQMFNIHIVTDSLGIVFAQDTAKIWNKGVAYVRPIAQEIPK